MTNRHMRTRIYYAVLYNIYFYTITV